jgi:hypothetical protein
LSTDADIAETVGAEIQKQFIGMKLKSDVFVSKINQTGARIANELDS